MTEFMQIFENWGKHGLFPLAKCLNFDVYRSYPIDPMHLITNVVRKLDRKFFYRKYQQDGATSSLLILFLRCLYVITCYILYCICYMLYYYRLHVLPEFLLWVCNPYYENVCNVFSKSGNPRSCLCGQTSGSRKRYQPCRPS